jgi:hypothetical protein
LTFRVICPLEMHSNFDNEQVLNKVNGEYLLWLNEVFKKSLPQNSMKFKRKVYHKFPSQKKRRIQQFCSRAKIKLYIKYIFPHEKSAF